MMPPSAPGLCINSCEYDYDDYCDDGGPGSHYADCELGTDCYDCGQRLHPSPPVPAYPPLVPIPAGALIVTGVPVVHATYSFPERSIARADVNNLSAAVAAFAGCYSQPMRCEIGASPSVGDRAVNMSSLTFLLSFPATLQVSSTVVLDPNAAVRAGDVSLDLRSTPVSSERWAFASDVLTAFAISDPPITTLGSTAIAAYTPPSPPPVPPPPSHPPGLCSNTCDLGGLGTPGVCNDGAAPDPSPFRQLCPYGTDCADCGSRDYCIDCPIACQERNSQLSDSQQDKACVQSSYVNDVCDEHCNNRECNYDNNVCTYSQIEATCMQTQDREQTDYSTRPLAGGLTIPSASSRTSGFRYVDVEHLTGDTRERGLVPVAMSLSLEPVRTVLQQEFNENFLFAEMAYTLQWSDPRLSQSPCAGALPGMLSLTFEQGLSDIARESARSTRAKFWVPKLGSGSSSVPGYRALDDSADFQLGTSEAPLAWLAGYGTVLPPPAAGEASDAFAIASEFFNKHVANTSACNNCASWTGDIELQLLQSHHSFFYYPFDQQQLEVSVQVPGAHLYGCVGTGADSPVLSDLGLTEENKNELLLPPTGMWFLSGPLEESIRVVHRRDRAGRELIDHCVIILVANRNPSVFIFRSLFTTIVVVFGSMMTALFMHPEEHAGDRAAVLYIAFLISLTNMATTNLGLGEVSQLLWFDIFNLSQLVICLIAVAETMIVHMLFACNHPKLATHIDKVCRITLPILYAGETAGMFIFGVGRGNSDAVGAAIMLTFAVFLIPSTLMLVWWRATRLHRAQQRAILALQVSGPDLGAEYDKKVEEVFHSFDVDSSGELDTDELRELFLAMHPNIKRNDLRECLKTMCSFEDVHGVLSKARFLDALIEGEMKLLGLVQSRGEVAAPVLSGSLDALKAAKSRWSPGQLVSRLASKSRKRSQKNLAVPYLAGRTRADAKSQADPVHAATNAPDQASANKQTFAGVVSSTSASSSTVFIEPDAPAQPPETVGKTKLPVPSSKTEEAISSPPAGTPANPQVQVKVSAAPAPTTQAKMEEKTQVLAPPAHPSSRSRTYASLAEPTHLPSRLLS